MIRLTQLQHSRNYSSLNLFYLSLFALVISNSCISLQSIDIQFSKKEPYPLPENIQSIAFLNRAMHSGFTNCNIDTLELSIFRNEEVNSVFHDSLAADTAMKVAAKALYESGRYDVVIPLNMNILRNDSFTLAEQLPSSFIEGICSDFQTNAVLVLESMEEKVITSYLTSSLLSKISVKYPLSNYPGLLGDIYVQYNSVWRLYTLCDSCDIKQYNITDAKYWTGEYSKLPYLKESLIFGGTASGLKLAKYISPEWENYYREYYVTHNKQIDKAIQLIKNSKWEEAAEIWSKYSTIPSKSVRSKVEFNLALASEMNGDLNQALEWCGKSLKTVWSENKMAYLSVLEQRQKIVEKDSGKRTL